MIACIDMSMTADKIKTMRHAQAMTQEDLVARSGISLATIQRAERGEQLSAASIASIAAAFGVAAKELTMEAPESFEAYLPLTPITAGRQLVGALRASKALDFGFCELDNLEDAKAIEAFYDFCMALAALEGAMSPTEQVTHELEAKEQIAALVARGFHVGGATFDITAYDVDDDGGMGMAVLFGQWDETRAALRVGRSTDEVTRAHVMDGLGKYEVPKGDAVIFPPAPQDDHDWVTDLAARPNEGEA